MKTKSNNKLINNEVMAARIKQLRRERGMTQDKLAKLLDVKRSAISNWENGLRCPEVKSINDMSVIFGVPVDYLNGTRDKKYNINLSDCFELDLTKLNSAGIQLIKDIYKVLVNSDDYRKDK